MLALAVPLHNPKHVTLVKVGLITKLAGVQVIVKYPLPLLLLARQVPPAGISEDPAPPPPPVSPGLPDAPPPPATIK